MALPLPSLTFADSGMASAQSGDVRQGGGVAFAAKLPDWAFFVGLAAVGAVLFIALRKGR